MNTRRKVSVLLAAVTLLPFVLHAAEDGPLVSRVAQSILEGEGFRLFSFSSAQPAPLFLTATLDGQVIKILDIPPSKEIVLAFKLGKENRVEAVHAHFTGGSAIRRYGSGFHDLTFTTLHSLNPIQEGTAFLTLRSEGHVLEFQLTKKSSTTTRNFISGTRQ